MYLRINLALVVWTILVCFGCRKTDLSDYYFPIQYLKQNPTVYAYRSMGLDSLQRSYSYLQVREDSTGKSFLVGQSYTEAFVPEQLTREQIVPTGTLMREAILYDTDVYGKAIIMPMTILQPAVFPFVLKDKNSRFIYQVQWQPDPQNANHTRHLLRNRSYAGDTTWTFEGRTVDAIKINLIEELEDRNEGSLVLKYGGTEIYARGVGLVYFRKDLENGPPVVFQLERRLPMAALEGMMQDAISK